MPDTVLSSLNVTSIRIPPGSKKEILLRDWKGRVGETTGTSRLLEF